MALRDELAGIYLDTVRRLSGREVVRGRLQGMSWVRPPAVLALGKASSSMLEGAASVLGPLRGIAVGPKGTSAPAGVEVIEGEHPVPGPGSLAAGERLLSFVRSLEPEDELLVLLSGGGSALAEALPQGISPGDLAALNRALLAAGVPIEGINAVRKHLSRIKGGRLAEACRARRIEVLAISDVEGDDPAVIASGPFWPDPTTFADALAVVRSIEIPSTIRRHLEEARQETPKAPHEGLRTTILAGPADLPRIALELATERGFAGAPWPGFVRGDVAEVAGIFTDWIRGAKGRRVLVAAAAEPTVRLPPNPGRGGRSQDLALRLAGALRSRDAAFLAAGSDGRDGVSDHAGAAVDGATAARAEAIGLDLRAYLAEARSEEAAARLGVAIPAWETGTNLADLHLLALG